MKSFVISGSLFTRPLSTVVLLLLMAGAVACDVSANSVGINIYGLSRHFDLGYTSRDRINEVHPGYGLRVTNVSCRGHIFFAEGGIFKDTFENKAKYIALGYKLRLWNQLRLGLMVGPYNTESINRGSTIMAGIPTMTFRVWRVTLNGVYLPKYEGINPYKIIAGYLTIHVFDRDMCKKRGGDE